MINDFEVKMMNPKNHRDLPSLVEATVDAVAEDMRIVYTELF